MQRSMVDRFLFPRDVCVSPSEFVHEVRPSCFISGFVFLASEGLVLSWRTTILDWERVGSGRVS